MKLKVRTQLGEQAKAINLVNVGYKRQLSADLSAIFTISDLFERTKKPALREHTGFDGHLPTHADRSNLLRWNRLFAWAVYKRANRPGSITMSSEHRTQRLQKVQS
jgi:hypothetical protein